MGQFTIRLGWAVLIAAIAVLLCASSAVASDPLGPDLLVPEPWQGPGGFGPWPSEIREDDELLTPEGWAQHRAHVGEWVLDADILTPPGWSK